MRSLIVALAALFSVPVLAATPSVSVQSVTVSENAGSARVVILKTKASSYSKVSVQTVDGTAKAGVDYSPVNVTLTLGNNTSSYALSVPIVDNATYQGVRQFSLKIAGVRNALVQTPTATVTINDNEVPPAAGDPNEIVNPPSAIAGAKVCRNWYAVPATDMCPTITYGDTVTAVSGCTGAYIPDALTVGGRYKVMGLWGPRPIASASGVISLSGVTLNPAVDDGVHRGDSYYGLWVPAQCVTLVQQPAAQRFAAAPARPALKFETAPRLVAIRRCFEAYDTQGHGNYRTAPGTRYALIRTIKPGVVWAKALSGRPYLGVFDRSCFKA